MTVGIMQPYFFPYIGYWQMINAVDKYVIFDDVNYIKRGWINRNRILYQDNIVYFGIPYCSIYGEVIQDKNGKYKTTGVERTGCIYCGFGIHQEKEPNRFQKLKKSHPHIWNYCMKSSECGGLGMKDIFEKMNASGNVAIHYE